MNNQGLEELYENSNEAAVEELYETVVLQTEGPWDPSFTLLPQAKQDLHVVMVMDMEIQNGGIAQFFWNNGSVYASKVSDALKNTGLSEIAELYDALLSDNQITMEEIDQYREIDPQLTTLYKRDWDCFQEFDDAYMNIWEETDFEQTILDFASDHPEIMGDE